MNIISRLKTRPATLIVTGTLLLGLVLTPISSIADSAKHESYSNKKGHASSRYQRDNRPDFRPTKNSHDTRGHQSSSRDHHDHKYQRHYDRRGYPAHNHRSGYHRDARYVVLNNTYRPRIIDRFGLEVGIHTGNLDIIFRD